MVERIVPFFIEHNLEAEAMDLLLEVHLLHRLLEYESLNQDNARRMGLYLLRCTDFMPTPEDAHAVLDVAFRLYLKHGFCSDALRVALRFDDKTRVRQVLEVRCCSRGVPGGRWGRPQVRSHVCSSSLASQAAKDPALRKQLALMMAQQRAFALMDVLEEGEDGEELAELAGNAKLSEYFHYLAAELDVKTAKTPEDVYKSHLAETARFTADSEDGAGAQVASAQLNLASSFVNAFVNSGFGADKLVTASNDDSQNVNHWVYQNKDNGKLVAAASLGMVHMWDLDEGLSALERFSYAGDAFVKSGAHLGIGVCSAGVYQPEIDAAIGLLSEVLEKDASTPDARRERDAALLALGLAHAGTFRDDVAELLTPVVADDEGSFNSSCIAAVALGLTFVGSCNDDAAATVVERIMSAPASDLDQPMAHMLFLALGLLFLGEEERAEAMGEVLATVEHDAVRYGKVVLDTCAYAYTGNVLQVQSMLHMCAAHLKEEKEARHQAAAVLGLGLVAAGEQVSRTMALRTTDHLLQYGELPVRRAVPLAIAALFPSNPDYAVIDTLSKLSHDADAGVASSAVLAMGIMGAGTNNAKLAGLLRQLSTFYGKEPNLLFLVRVAQGLLHAGKGLVTINPRHSDNALLNKPALAGLLVVLNCGLQPKGTILGEVRTAARQRETGMASPRQRVPLVPRRALALTRCAPSPAQHEHLLYAMAVSMQPRMVVTVNEDLEPVAVPVRVGQAVEVVGQAGNPRAITGFQTHDTPVLLSTGERAELADDDYEALTSVLEGVVIVRKRESEEEGKAQQGAGEAGAGAGMDEEAE